MKISQSLPIVLLSAVALGVQPSGHAQGNIVNLYDWRGETMYASDPNYGIIISAATAAIFFGAYSTNRSSGPDHIVPILTGNLETTPGATYEVSYTLGHDGSFGYCDGSLSFGSFNFSFRLPKGSNGQPFQFASTNFDFLVTAASPSTRMSFVWSAIDNGDAAILSNFSVTTVPEISATRLFGFWGGVLLLGQQWQRLFPKRKRN